MELPEGHPIVFYDGDCGFCDRFVQWTLRHDRKQVFRYAPLQGSTALEMIGPPEGDPSGWSVQLIDEDGQWERSAAALRIARRIGWGFGLPQLGLWVPGFIRDGVYRLIAKVRYRIFGKVTSCRLLSPEARLLFLP